MINVFNNPQKYIEEINDSIKWKKYQYTLENLWLWFF